MKGVKINNYIDNRIVLSARKLKNQVQTVIQSNRPRPMVIRQLNYYEEEEEQVPVTDQKDATKTFDNRTAKKQKKRSKASISNHNQITNPSNQKVEKRQKIKKEVIKRERTTSAKKRSINSSPDARLENQFNSTQKKLRSLPKSSEGLGKRSKSAIIKRNKSPPNVHTEPEERKLKIFENHKKQIQQPKKKKTKKDKEKEKEKEKEKKSMTLLKGKESKKNLSTINSERKKKYEKESGLKTSRPPSKSFNSSSVYSKQISARDNKKKETNIMKNLFGEEETERKSNHITLQELLNIQKNDVKVKSAIMKLEDAINSKANRKKLSQKLEKLAEKLKEISSDNSESEEEDSFNHSISGQKRQRDEQKNRIRQFIPSQSRQQSMKQTLYDDNFPIKEFQNQQIQSKLSKVGEQEMESPREVNSEEEGYEQYPEEDSNAKQGKNDDISDEKRSGFYRKSENEEDDNIMIGRKGGADLFADLADYQSINSVKSSQDEKAKEISQLKKFQEQSDLMMKRIKQLDAGRTIQQPLSLDQPLTIPKSNIGTQASPRALDYAFEKYPTTINLKSPKFNSSEIISVIKLKEKVLTDRHEKLSELVNVMFDRKIVSPKTYTLQVQSLREQQLHDSEVLDSYKKHAEQLAQLLSDIKKEKEEISSIDELIRSEKWEQAIHVIGVPDPQSKHSSEDPNDHTYKQILPHELHSENSEQTEQVLYEGEDSEISDVAMQLGQMDKENEIKNQPQEGEKDQHQTKEEDDSSDSPIVIKMDQPATANPVVKRKGFDSNLFFIKEYCIALCQFVRDNHRADFRRRIGQPMSFDLQKLLKSFRTNRDGSVPLSINSLFQDLQYHDCNYHQNTPPISKQIYDVFNQQYQSIKYYGKQESEDATLEGIFLKSIYDALNESINIEKPGSINGRALPWAHNSKHLKNLKNQKLSNQKLANHKISNQESEDLIFGISIARIIQWGSCLCGFIPDTIELQNTEIDEEYVNHIRETRTALLLEKMLADEEALMYRTELQETQVKLQLGKILFDELLKEVEQELRKIVLRVGIRDLRDFGY